MDFYGDNTTLGNLKNIISGFDAGIIEIMVHPAYVDDKLKSISSYNKKRQKELDILTTEGSKDWLKVRKVELVSFSELNNN
ncbi:ChbG/HpnK family deacetylase [Halonatronum saccharophilum]|uniref:ChbG/HpnK family deacetylase n=1 Tax=Halonatronum saccharophilum TaxID=150060 RepID=UPI000482BAAA|nr:ChbG/HpnK family deacetylase [Halonatronum saccharophilum]